MAKFDALFDSFASPLNNTGRWTPFATGTATQARNAGQLLFTPPNATAGSNYAGYTSATTYDLIASYVYIQVPQMVSTATSAQCYMKLTLNASNNIQIIQSLGTIKAQRTVAGIASDIAAGVAYNASTHAWWRIREVSGTTFFDYSTNGSTWVNHTSLLNPFVLTALTLEIAAGTFASAASPGAARFDNFNVIGGGRGLMLSGIGT